jgi:hypothetical protein
MTININPIWATTIVQKIALYCSTYMGNDIYYLKQSINLLINLYGEKTLVEMMKKDESPNKDTIRKIGETWFDRRGMKNNLMKISKISEKLNKTYSVLEDKKLTKEKRANIDFQSFLDQCEYLPLIENDLYALFVFLVQNCSVQNMNISQQYLKVLDSGGKTFGGVRRDRMPYETHTLQQP